MPDSKKLPFGNTESDRLRNCVCEIDTVAYFGGDEFVVMLSDLNKDQSRINITSQNRSGKIRVALAEPYLIKIRHEAVTEDVITSADMAMYQAKEAGGNSIRFYELKA